jgi:hypothetical protein
VAPVWSPGLRLPRRVASEEGLVVHNFANPDAFQGLYSVGMHERDGHLTKTGAGEYSRLLGRLVVKRLEAAE